MGGIPYKEFMYKMCMAQGYKPLFALPLKPKYRYTAYIKGLVFSGQQNSADVFNTHYTQWGIFMQDGLYRQRVYDTDYYSNYELRVYKGTEQRPKQEYLGKVQYSDITYLNPSNGNYINETVFNTVIPADEAINSMQNRTGYVWWTYAYWEKDFLHSFEMINNNLIYHSIPIRITRTLRRGWWDKDTETYTKVTQEEKQYFEYSDVDYIVPMFPMYKMRNTATIRYLDGLTQDIFNQIFSDKQIITEEKTAFGSKQFSFYVEE